MPIFESSFYVRAPLARVWAFHNDPRALPKVMPRLFGLQVERYPQPLRTGSMVALSIGFGPFRQQWLLQVTAHEPPHQFVDEQLPGRGPFKRWRHTHRFEASSDLTRIIDRIEYELPFGIVGKIAAWLSGALIMKVTFASRRAATRRALETATSMQDAAGAAV